MPQAPILSRRICLEAVDRSRNVARRYTIVQSEDLFGHVLVEWSWGRIGTRGQSRRVSFSRRADAERFVEQRLRRRAAAPKRIGVAYRVSGEDAGIEPSQTEPVWVERAGC